MEFFCKMFPSALIFQQYNYFRQNLEEKSLSLSQISFVKYYETIKILMQIFEYTVEING